MELSSRVFPHPLPSSSISLEYVFNGSVLKRAGRPLSSIETFAQEFVPTQHDLTKSTDNLTLNNHPSATTAPPDEVPIVSIHALDVLAEINAQKNPQLAKQCLMELAEKYDTIRKGYWEFRMEKVGQVAVQS
jgi:hypothetical protein